MKKTTEHQQKNMRQQQTIHTKHEQITPLNTINENNRQPWNTWGNNKQLTKHWKNSKQWTNLENEQQIWNHNRKLTMTMTK